MKLEINTRRKIGKFVDMYKLNNTLLNNYRRNQKRHLKYLETNEDRNITAKLMGCSKSSLREKFIAINSYMKEKERSQRNNLNLHLKFRKN